MTPARTFGPSLRVMEGRGHGDALAARQQLVSIFLDAIRALPDGWHTGVSVNDRDCDDFVAGQAQALLYSLALFRKYQFEEDGLEFSSAQFNELVCRATLPNKRRMDRRHLAVLRRNAEQAAKQYADFAREIGEKVVRDGDYLPC